MKKYAGLRYTLAARTDEEREKKEAKHICRNVNKDLQNTKRNVHMKKVNS